MRTSSARDRRSKRCPICGRPSQAETRPFCSRRCKEVDLGRWLDGAYRVPTGEAPAEAERDRDESERPGDTASQRRP
ncbi:MAG TPA: DNA gyrase inhibitor YacG [Kiloniellales bacterium]|nr:DNA gyrase inhibitor YacG [Kiloniellales bacterium]